MRTEFASPHHRSNLSPEAERLIQNITIKLVTLPFNIIIFPFKLVTLPFDLLAKAFSEIGNATAPGPLKYIIGSPFYIMAGIVTLPILPFKLITLPFDLIISGMKTAIRQSPDLTGRINRI